MTKERASLGFGEELETFNPAAWSARQPTVSRPHPAAVRQIAEAAGFASREPQLVRGRRTGRNMQLNLKARPDTVAALCAVADANGWGLGETLEQAVAGARVWQEGRGEGMPLLRSNTGSLPAVADRARWFNRLPLPSCRCSYGPA